MIQGVLVSPAMVLSQSIQASAQYAFIRNNTIQNIISHIRHSVQIHIDILYKYYIAFDFQSILC